ncbi:MAG: enoyl-CoA hydratase/isomerase family protein [Thermoplasmatota archaeon]
MATEVDFEGNVAVVRFVRAERNNAFDLGALRELHRTIRSACDREDVRVVVLTGSGRAFCAGADLRDLGEDASQAPHKVADLTREFHSLIDLLHAGPKVTVAAVNGAAAGGGLGLALACDYRIGSPAARMRPAYLRIGLAPDGGATHFLVHYAGLAAAQRILLRNEELDAAGALRLGLLHEIVDDLDSRAKAVAGEFASRSGPALAATKRLLAQAPDRPVAQQLAAEREAIINTSATQEFRTGLESFLKP